jgi:hypothetical protein
MASKRGVELTAEMLSQLTILHVCGISPRVYLELLRADGCPVRVIKLGKLRLVRREEFVGWLESLAAPPRTAVEFAEEPPAPEEDPDAVDDWLQGLGFRRKRAAPAATDAGPQRPGHGRRRPPCGP